MYSNSSSNVMLKLIVFLSAVGPICFSELMQRMSEYGDNRKWRYFWNPMRMYDVIHTPIVHTTITQRRFVLYRCTLFVCNLSHLLCVTWHNTFTRPHWQHLYEERRNNTRPLCRVCDSDRAVFVRFSLGEGQSFDWRLATACMEVAKLVPWNSLLN